VCRTTLTAMVGRPISRLTVPAVTSRAFGDSAPADAVGCDGLDAGGDCRL
jgi:hypothetical protein